MLFKLTAPNDLAAVHPILAFAEELATGLKLSRQDCLSIRLAVEEAVANVIEHAFEPGEEESFEVLFETDPSQLTITIREKGMPMQVAQRAELESGMGFKLMKASMDQMVFRNLGREGKEVSLVKFLPRPANCSVDEAVASVVPETAPASVGPIQVRLFSPEDAPEVSKAAYQTYRFAYSDFIYYPDQIVEMNRMGRLHSAVACSSEGKVLGHVALKFATPGAVIAETGALMVLPQYRHTRAVLRLSQFILARAEALGLAGLYSQAVTAHTISQKATALFGYKDCAILIGALYSDLTFRGIETDSSQKETAAVSYRQLRPRAERVIYAPARHREMIRKIYESLQLPVNLSEACAEEFKGEFRLHCTKDASTNTAEMTVEGYGAGVVAEVAEILRELKLDRVEAIYLRLDLEDPLTASLAGEFEPLGFFFAGILPCVLSGRDCLILQCLNNLRMDSSKLKMHSATGQELLGYIKSVASGTL